MQTVTDKAKQSNLLDNHERGSVGDFLRSKLLAGADFSVVSAYFTIYAHAALRDELNALGKVRFLFGEPRFIKALDPSRDGSPAFKITGDELGIGQTLKQSKVARECAQWFKSKVEVRSIVKPGFLHGKMYAIKQGHYDKAVMGSSNFTVQGLGLGGRPNYELNLEITDSRDRDALHEWFDDAWNDPQLTQDVKAEVLRHLERLYTPNSPQFLYYKTLYHLFGLTNDLPDSDLKQPQSLYDSDIWQALFEFQKHGALSAIRKLEHLGGCILADSVGLGKTYTALAVIRYFENLNARVLVLTPKKLRENWTVYQAQNNSKLNPFGRDRFAFSVLSHTDLSRESGTVGDLHLETLNWGNYDLVVIDESHNFRNNTRGRRDEDGQVIRRSRYERLMDDIVKAGIPTKVLLLSATPVNNDLRDLRNQMMLMGGGDDAAYSAEDKLGVASIRSVLDRAQITFGRWAESGGGNAETLLGELDSRLFTLLDGLTIARSREHIRRYYAEALAALGGFPRREAPISVTADVDTLGMFPSYEKINALMDTYQLALFSPSSFLRSDLTPGELSAYVKEDTRNFSQVTRERSLIGMMKVNFLKRLESALPSFQLTLERTTAQIEAMEDRLKAYLEGETGGTVEAPQMPLADDDDEAEAAFMVGEKVRYDLRHLDVRRWLTALETDRQNLSGLLGAARQVTPERDAKLAELRGLLAQKFTQPTLNLKNEPNRKAIVFTAFADTAQYLYAQLRDWALAQGVQVALVTGTGANQTTLGRPVFGEILTNFSPRSKRRDLIASLPQDAEIDLLIATDCISEGQNLQDCDLLINYDIHWNPVRLIQRFGRIDRIGSQSRSIQMVNFWPTDDLNAYLNLRARVEARMALVDLTATGQDNPLSAQVAAQTAETELSYRDKQLLRLRDEIPDLEELNGSVSLADFSLDDFRADLSNYLGENMAEIRDAPLGLHAVTGAANASENLRELARPGILFCLKQVGGQDTGQNPLHPHFLVYVRYGDAPEVRFATAQARQSLDLYRALCAGKDKHDELLSDFFDERTQHGEHLDGEGALLKSALDAIRSRSKRATTKQLFAGRGALLPKQEDQIDEATPFELVTWLVIADAATQEQT